MNFRDSCDVIDGAKTRHYQDDLNQAACRRLLETRGDPLLYADWLWALFIHFEVDAEALQREVPFPLDLREGRAYVSLVGFTMRGMRPRLGGKLAALLFKPIATHRFLNVRTYVRHHGEPGIHFLAEWMDNPISVLLGPAVFGLPYRLGRLQYHHHHEVGELHGQVSQAAWPIDHISKCSTRLEYRAEINTSRPFVPCEPDSLDEFLLERYSAFNGKPSRPYLEIQANPFIPKPIRPRFFRIWHPPWPQVPACILSLDTSLLAETWSWFVEARLVGANYSPGVQQVWMGRPQAALC